jgi:hypothetical protein
MHNQRIQSSQGQNGRASDVKQPMGAYGSGDPDIFSRGRSAPRPLGQLGLLFHSLNSPVGLRFVRAPVDEFAHPDMVHGSFDAKCNCGHVIAYAPGG